MFIKLTPVEICQNSDFIYVAGRDISFMERIRKEYTLISIKNYGIVNVKETPQEIMALLSD